MATLFFYTHALRCFYERRGLTCGSDSYVNVTSATALQHSRIAFVLKILASALCCDGKWKTALRMCEFDLRSFSPSRVMSSDVLVGPPTTKQRLDCGKRGRGGGGEEGGRGEGCVCVWGGGGGVGLMFYGSMRACHLKHLLAIFTFLLIQQVLALFLLQKCTCKIASCYFKAHV